MSYDKNDMKMPPGKFIATVKIGAKGQIVLPKDVRDMFGISAGDSLLLLADIDRGIALNTVEYFNKVADAAFERGNPNKQQADFAQAVRNATDESEDKPQGNMRGDF